MATKFLSTEINACRKFSFRLTHVNKGERKKTKIKMLKHSILTEATVKKKQLPKSNDLSSAFMNRFSGDMQLHQALIVSTAAGKDNLLQSKVYG